MITWTLTEGAFPEGGEPGQVYWEVNGDAADPHDARHYPNLLAALHFLIGSKCKRGDTIHIAGADTGRVLRVGLVMVDQKIEYDVGTRQLANPAELIEWLATTLQAGDTVSYLPID